MIYEPMRCFYIDSNLQDFETLYVQSSDTTQIFLSYIEASVVYSSFNLRNSCEFDVEVNYCSNVIQECLYESKREYVYANLSSWYTHNLLSRSWLLPVVYERVGHSSMLASIPEYNLASSGNPATSIVRSEL